MIGAALFAVLALSSSIAQADEMKTILKNQVLSKSQFLCGEEVTNEGSIKGDLFSGAKIISSSGIITGDFIAGGQDISSSGTVNGDILCGGESIDISGAVDGDIRCGGANISISGKIEKNVNVFGESIKIKPNTQIGRNLLAFGKYIKIDGKVNGYTKLGGHRIILNGEFFQDVDINTETIWDSGPNSSVTILPGTIIHGKLTYRSTAPINIPKGAVVNSSQWIKSTPPKTENQISIRSISVSFIKMIVATVAYFLFAMLFFRLFPGIFKNLSQAIQQNPLMTAGVGLLGILSILITLIGIIILVIFSIVFETPELLLLITTASIWIYTGLVCLASIPVALWVGELLVKNRPLHIQFALGLGSLALCQFILDVLGNTPKLGPAFEMIQFILCLGILLLGSGALIRMAKKVIRFVRTFDPISA